MWLVGLHVTVSMESQRYLTSFPKRTGREFAFQGFLLFIYFRFHFLCPCDPSYATHTAFCVMYIVLPAFFSFLISCVFGCLRAKAFYPNDDCCTFAGFMRALFIGTLWVILVFFEGDWLVCMKTHADTEDQLACKLEESMTATEKRNVRYYTNISRVSISNILYWRMLSARIL